MTSVRVARLLFLLLLAKVVEIVPQCTPVCESYHFSTFPAVIDDGITHFFTIAANGSSLQPRSSEINNMSLFTPGCDRISKSICRVYIEENVDGHFTGNFTCNELQDVRGERVILALELESQENRSYSCLTLIQPFVFESSKLLTIK